MKSEKKQSRQQEAKQRILDLIHTRANVVGLELTTYCPLQCKYCGREKLARKDRHMEWERFITIKEGLAGIKNVVLCGIGEPMVYPHIYDVVSHLTQKVLMITSGTVAIDYKRLNRNRNLECVVFSVDVPEETQMIEFTGNYQWSNLEKNLTARRENAGVARVINCTVTANNYKQVTDIARLAVQYKLQAISFTLEMQRDCQEGKPILTVPPEAEDYLEEAARIARKKGVAYSNSLSHIRCISKGSIIPFITLEGDLYPCCHGLSTFYKVGNLLQASYQDIWESDQYKAFKQGKLCFKHCPVFENVTKGVSHEEH